MSMAPAKRCLTRGGNFQAQAGAIDGEKLSPSVIDLLGVKDISAGIFQRKMTR